MQKLTIVVNCTDRKSVAPNPELRVGSLPSGNTYERASAWRKRVSGSRPQATLVDLYNGEAWLQAKALAADARDRGYSVSMLVASAGLGLRDVTQVAPSYAATFASGHADTVTPEVRDGAEWWRHLADLPRTTTLPKQESVLLVLSENYARAMDADLATLSTSGGDHLLIGGWRNHDGLPRVPADRELRQELGGTVSSLSLRMARRWLDRKSGTELYTKQDASRWARWARGARRPEIYDRAITTDDGLTVIVVDLLREDPDLSATRALRIVRDRGIACEQKRFGALFRSVKNT